MNTNQYLDAIMERHSIRSDYALAKFLGVRQQTVSRYRLNKNGLDDAVAVRVAEALQKDPAEVLADIHAERAKDDSVRAVWQRLAKLARSSAHSIAALSLAVFVAYSAGAGQTAEAAICILCQIGLMAGWTSNFRYLAALRPAAGAAFRA